MAGSGTAGGLSFLPEQDHGVLEGQQHTGVDIEGQVEVERPAAPLFGVQVHLLADRRNEYVLDEGCSSCTRKP